MEIFFLGNEYLSFLLSQIIDIKTISEGDLKEEFDNSFLITDDSIFKMQNQDFSCFRKVFIFSDKIDTNFFQINKNRYNIIYLKKEEYVDIHEIFLKEKKILEGCSKVILNDIGNDSYIPLKEITYFSYDRAKKKSFAIIENQKKYLKKSLMELEDILPKDIFERVERGIILNISLIKEINYKEEYVLMRDDEKIYLGKIILKKIKEATLKDYHPI